MNCKPGDNKPQRYAAADCRVVTLPKHMRPNGNLTVVENDITLPFAVRRVYYLYDVPAGRSEAAMPIKSCNSFSSQ